MNNETISLLAIGIFIIACLYSSVGHAGASGYIAIMSLLSFPPEEIKPIALTLNIFVASITAWNFWKAGYLSWRLLWPFTLFSIPCAFLGALWVLPTSTFKILLGVILICSALRLITDSPIEKKTRLPSYFESTLSGASIGFISGLTGTGGGIFLTPILLFKKWAKVKEAAAVSSFFILANSIAGLSGNFSKTLYYPQYAFFLLGFAILGGFLGSRIGSFYLEPKWIKLCLSMVLMIAGVKLLIT
jgi:uncharacterized membrane protein YfcA